MSSRAPEPENCHGTGGRPFLLPILVAAILGLAACGGSGSSPLASPRGSTGVNSPTTTSSPTSTAPEATCTDEIGDAQTTNPGLDIATNELRIHDEHLELTFTMADDIPPRMKGESWAVTLGYTNSTVTHSLELRWTKSGWAAVIADGSPSVGVEVAYPPVDAVVAGKSLTVLYPIEAIRPMGTSLAAFNWGTGLYIKGNFVDGCGKGPSGVSFPS